MRTLGAAMQGLQAFLKPFAWLAALGFLAGFGSYLAIGHPLAAHAAEQAQAAMTSGPASDEWNLPKHI
jgi:hypothetical protein